jgi:hypothetical protein
VLDGGERREVEWRERGRKREKEMEREREGKERRTSAPETNKQTKNSSEASGKKKRTLPPP